MPRHAIHLGTAWEPPVAGAPAWVRHFGRPAGVEPGDRLLIVCEQPESLAAWRAATLNGHGLAWSEPLPGVFESDVSGLLEARNRLVVPATAEASGDERPSGGREPLPTAWGRLSLVVVSD